MNPLRRRLIEALDALRRNEREQERKAMSRLDGQRQTPLRLLLLRHQAAVRQRLACHEQIMEMLGDAQSADALCCMADERCARLSTVQAQGEGDAHEGAAALALLNELQRELAALIVGYRSLAQLADALAMARLSGLLARPRAELDRVLADAERIELDITLAMMSSDMMSFDMARAGRMSPAFPKRRNERCCV
jgi:hypothetical protein